MAVTLAQLITSIRELSFDRFVTPTLFIGSNGKPNYFLEVKTDRLLITDRTTGTPVIKTELLFSHITNFEMIATALVTDAEQYAVSYSSSFMGGDSSSNLLPLSPRPIDSPVPIFRSHFFSDEKIIEVIHRYLEQILYIRYEDIPSDLTELDHFIQSLMQDRPRHLALWTAFWAIDERRVYELAGEVMGQSTFSFSGDSNMIGIQQDGGNIDVTIGDTFRLSDSSQTKFNEGERPYGVGADNVLGDAYSFWYRLQLWIRKQVELMFGDYSLRPESIMVGVIDLQKDQNFYAYYDQFPYTISPLSREILSSMESMH